MDVIIDGSLITAVEPRREYADSQVLDLGDVTILPGFIDSYASIPPGDPARAGLQLLSYGVTTIISDERRSDFDPQLWESEGSPGPRLLLAADASINAIVTDPPYGLSFMGKGWDKVLPPRAIWEECLPLLSTVPALPNPYHFS